MLLIFQAPDSGTPIMWDRLFTPPSVWPIASCAICMWRCCLVPDVSVCCPVDQPGSTDCVDFSTPWPRMHTCGVVQFPLAHGELLHGPEGAMTAWPHF